MHSETAAGLKVFSGKQTFHDFAFFETVTGNHYFAGNEILSRLHKQTACDISRKRGHCSLTQLKSQFPSSTFLGLEEKGAGSSLSGLDYILFQLSQS